MCPRHVAACHVAACNLHPPHPARSGVVVYVLPLAILGHLLVCYVLFESLTGGTPTGSYSFSLTSLLSPGAGGISTVPTLASLAVNGAATLFFILRVTVV